MIINRYASFFNTTFPVSNFKSAIWYGRMVLAVIFVCFLLNSNLSEAQTAKKRPSIGITLSGGGAKGLAHIGILKAIDSVGLTVDYVTGTSMGAVVGSLYAAGYNGDEILQIARGINWDLILTNKPELKNVALPEKEEFGEYLVELPIEKGKVKFSRGLLESNELWLTLSKLFLPFYQIKDFQQLPRPFQCVAADVVTGERVDLKKGDLVQAVRASMAIPSVFTPVSYEGRLLVDGGIIRNFPIENAKEMGADFVIGSDVSTVLYKEEELLSPIDILNQISFFRESEDYAKQKDMADIYVALPVGSYSPGSFASAEKIIQIGLEAGRKLYPKLKSLKDSLDVVYGVASPRTISPRIDSVYIAEVKLAGVPESEASIFIKAIGLKNGEYYTAEKINQQVRRIYGLRYLQKVTYSLELLPDGKTRLVFNVLKMPKTSARFGLAYNSALGIGIKAGVKSRGFPNVYSSLAATLSLGENPRAEAKYSQYLGKNKSRLFTATFKGENTNITSYNQEFDASGEYNQNYFSVDVQFVKLKASSLAFGLGTQYEWVRYKPNIIADLQAKGRTSSLISYVTVQVNTLNTEVYPTKGLRVDARGGYVYSQNPNFTIYNGNDFLGSQASSFFNFDGYFQLKLQAEQHFKLARHSFFYQIHSGVNFNYKQVLLNDFYVGGLNQVMRNQITFAGLLESSILTSSAAVFQLGYQHRLFTNTYLTARANSLWHDFIPDNFKIQPEDFGIGYSLSLGYKSFLGPIDISLMYSDINKKFTTYFNVGFPLGY